MGLFRRRAPRECFFCLSPDERTDAADRGLGALGPGVSAAAGSASSAWRCAACQCWNVRDRNGVVVSDLPAMHNPSLNGESFALRGQPSSTRLPSQAAATPFCRDCVTNQTLVMNLLGNYLPDESDPTYSALEAELPRYIASLHERYPPVCASCQPAVDEALKRSDQRAQAEAWGRALRRGSTTKAQDNVPSLSTFEVGVWRARGVAWVLDAALCWGTGLAAWRWPEVLSQVANKRVLGLRVTTALLVLRAVSILWAVWDPTWLRRARAGGDIRVEGRSTWVTTMLGILCLRAGAAVYLTIWRRNATRQPAVLIHTAIADAIAVVVALYQLRVSAPVPLTLVRPVQTAPLQSTSTPSKQPPVSFSSLSLSPTRTPTPAAGPVFGRPSLANDPPAPRDESEPMDWEPAPGATTPDERSEWDSFGVGRQRMFPNGNANDETGLESLLAGWGISTGSAAAPGTMASPQSQPLPLAPLAPSRGLVLDDALLRKFRKLLLLLRCAALTAAVVCVAVGLRLTDFSLVPPALRTLLALEAGTSALAFVVCLVSVAQSRLVPLAAIVLASDAAVRTSALLSTAVPASLPYEALAWAGPEIACTAWAVLDAMVIAST